ncbi:MAG: hypothetical protein A2Z15_05400 [Chloroflexi bacterium RBG_16_50_11]|nr:MAG: hypothetical protein A2Z15_05400 [Chloroflexi bacterium RBG_16_50_11]
MGGADPEEEQETNGRSAHDLKPEYCNYRDEGCVYAKACLECPFPQCLYDEPRGGLRWLKRKRDKEIRKLFKTGRNIKELAALFGLSPRTIQRALGEGLEISNKYQGIGNG